MPIETPSPLPPICPIEVRISTTKSLWFDLVFVVGTQGRIVEASNTMFHSGQLTDWLKQIVRKDPCPVLDVDREGAIDRLEARHIDEERVRLTIFDCLDASCRFVDAVVSRKKLVWEVYFELMALSSEIGGDGNWPEQRPVGPDRFRLPTVEDWLDWPRHGNKYSMHDPVSGRERA